jgi:hypothetical protein
MEGMVDGLHKFRVILREDLAYDHTLTFECWAEDRDHAKEQALNAYPRGKVLTTYIMVE